MALGLVTTDPHAATTIREYEHFDIYPRIVGPMTPSKNLFDVSRGRLKKRKSGNMYTYVRDVGASRRFGTSIAAIEKVASIFVRVCLDNEYNAFKPTARFVKISLTVVPETANKLTVSKQSRWFGASGCEL
jgi:hypothetical protein